MIDLDRHARDAPWDLS